MEEAISARYLTKCFRSGSGEDFYALRDVCIEIPMGKLTVLKGRSGSGKTTLLNMLSTLDDPTSGEIFFFGKSISGMKKEERELLRRREMGFVFQSVGLIPVMDAYENVDFALRLAGIGKDRDSRIREILGRVGLLKRMDHMVHQLSGGEQQRVAIARAVAHHPKVVFADEPTGELDTASGLAVMKLFLELVEAEKTTIVMSTHDENLMEFGDVVYEISDGRII